MIVPRLSAPTTSDGPAIVCSGVSFAYSGAAAPALENVSLRVERGERLGILGPNGGGKSTLLKIILGLLAPDAGDVKVAGFSPAEARARGVIGYVPQRPDMELGMPVSVCELVTLGAAWRTPAWAGVAPAVDARVDRMLKLTGADAFMNKPIGALSGGQMQRALIARALAADAQIIALDEPTVGIDAIGQERFAELLKTIHRELGVTILVVTHDLRAIVAGSDRVACLARRLHSHVSPEGLTPRVLAELFSHDIAGIGSVAALAGMHIHAHGPGEPCLHADHHHAQPVPLSVKGAPRADA
jgi:zinc transport system ATP-binding protein